MKIIVAGTDPGYLRYNGGGPAFLCGPDNAETFLFLGDLNPDGTRSNGQQQLIIDRFIVMKNDTVTQSGVSVGSGDVTWPNPASVGGEIALYIHRSVSSDGES